MHTFFAVLFSLALADSLPAQDSTITTHDDTRINIMKPTVPEFLREQPLRFSSFALDVVSANTPGSLNRWGMYVPEYSTAAGSQKIDLTAPLKLQLMRQEENKTMYSILGSVQLGGTAYLLYRHIKKNKGIK